MDYRSQLRQYAEQALTTADTMAGTNVFVGRDWPTNGSVYPGLLVQTYRERKESRAKGSQVPQFIATLVLSVVGRIQAMGNESAATTIESDLDTFATQIECAILCYQGLLENINRFSFVDMEMDVTANGRQHIGEVQFNFGLEYSVDFDPAVDAPVAWTPLAAPLTTVEVTYEQPNGTTEPGLIITLP